MDHAYWWLHLRRCAACGHVRCCDDSLNRHVTAHAAAAGHPVILSFEAGEDWFWNYTVNAFVTGPRLADPQSHPATQPVPGPAGRVRADWENQLAG
ncbi:UBP-type zinc finger domain-containing protein [Cryobacterium sp. PAMC25264]|uniref:UBP-type zinc finger domain-containing protein n=1 Tax=Cryobacterium sp. PAMC25264 TaxID=2861288 RepID=UPI0021050AE4|nr:UBP-type zinc finger domain-containing protein [Cryobacterium sp. PAMC25264]